MCEKIKKRCYFVILLPFAVEIDFEAKSRFGWCLAVPFSLSCHLHDLRN
jgi:hypothetical protein